jgi:hypothetical protein
MQRLINLVIVIVALIWLVATCVGPSPHDPTGAAMITPAGMNQ